jgi:hypothetical protein
MKDCGMIEEVGNSSSTDSFIIEMMLEDDDDWGCRVLQRTQMAFGNF